jgi:hypothetical protein
MQKEMATEIEHSSPKFLVSVNVGASWLGGPGSEKFIFRWADAYVRDHYDLVGIVDIMGPGNNSVYKWYGDARGYRPLSPANVSVFQRR